MKILHISCQRPECTGSGIYLQFVIKNSVSKGHDNFLVAGTPHGTTPAVEMTGAEKALFVRFEGGDLDFAVVGMSDVMPYRSRCFSSLSPEELESYLNVFEERISQAVSLFKPEIIHTHHLWLVTAVARRLFPRIPMVTTCHGTGLRQYVNCPHLRHYVKPHVGGIDCVMALSRAQVGEITSLLGIERNKIHVVGGGFDDSLFSPGEKKEAPPVEILYAGKFSKAKGVPWLLKSLVRIKDLPWRLHMAGNGTGEEMTACMKLVKTLGDRVVVHGPLSHQELARLMKKSHLFVLPSFFEGLPLVLLEALASGCRIVTTSLAGSKELLEEAGDDFVRMVALPPLETVDAPFAKDEKRLEEMLAREIANQVERVIRGENIDRGVVNKITASHTWPEVWNRIETVYQKAVNGKR